MGNKNRSMVKRTIIMRYITLICLLFLTTTLMGQSKEKVFFKAIAENDIETITNLIGKRVELCLLDEQDMYSKREALNIVKKWLEEAKPSSFSELHGGESKDEKTYYKVAKLITSQGNYRVFVLIDSSTPDGTIKKIQIDAF